MIVFHADGTVTETKKRHWLDPEPVYPDPFTEWRAYQDRDSDWIEDNVTDADLSDIGTWNSRNAPVGILNE